MSSTFPAFQLLLVLSVTLIIGLPVLVWLFMRGARDRGANLWFAAVACNAMALILVGYWGRFSAEAAVLFVLAVGLGIESMRWELERPAIPWRLAAAAWIAYAAFQLWLQAQGLRMSVGYTINLTLLVLGDAWLLLLLWRVSRCHDSRGLLIVAVGIGIVLLPNGFRLFQAFMEGGGPEAFSGSPATNVAVVLVTLVSVLHVVGYGGFVVEKLHRRQLARELAEARAIERQRVAERHTQELQSLVQQRDEMILLNSRFSAVSNLALYNSAIVHEISQPLQALISILDRMSLRDTDPTGQQSAGVQNALTMVNKMAATLTTLRTLMAGHQAPMEPVTWDEILDELLPILQTQARRQNVRLERQTLLPSGAVVKVNRVLLQRVIFNVVTNAFESLCGNDAKDRQEGLILLTTKQVQEHGMTYAVLRVQDNGPGLPAGLALKPGLALQTTKDNGLGVGLSFAQMIVESWHGELLAYNDLTSAGHGAIVEIRLPLVPNT